MTNKYQDKFTDWMDNFNHPCAADLRAAWITWKTQYPALPLPACGPFDDSIQLCVDSKDQQRTLQLDLWPDDCGEIFWRDRTTNDFGGDEDRHANWVNSFAERIPWLLGL